MGLFRSGSVDVFAMRGAGRIRFFWMRIRRRRIGLLMQISHDAVAGGVPMMDRGAEGPPYAPVPRVLLEHAFRMKLQADDEAMPGIVKSFHQTIFRMRHRPQAAAQA